MTPPGPALYDTVLLDRDGTLVEDVPYNGDPEKVRPVPGARPALDRLRAAGLRLAVVTNQSGLARGLFTERQMLAVHARIEELLGPFDDWVICPHDETDGCACRKPAPGLVYAAARSLGTTARRCVLVGDIGRDMAAALAAGASGILVPTPVTRPEEIAAAPAVAPDLPAAVDEILRRTRAVRPAAPRTGRTGTVLVVRSDSVGDVLVTGPGIRAVAAGAQRVVLLCGPRGRAAADLLPGVDDVIEWPLPWIDRSPGPVDPADLRALTGRLAQVGADEAVVFTSYHQSPLPIALLLRMAGVPRISAISDDYPGSLLDVRHQVPVGVPEPERALSLAAAAGFALAPGDEPALRLRDDVLGAAQVALSDATAASEAPATALPTGDFVVVHPGSSAPARACPANRCADIVAALVAGGHRVVVTGGPDERELTARVSAAGGTDLGGAVDLAGLARILSGARCVVVGNTGPAHLAAAVGVPVVSLFAPTVPFGQWGPYRVPTVRIGDAGAACRDTRAAVCPVAGHPCLSDVDPAEVVAAVRVLAHGPPH
ncbi:histidinol-phosphate phosphatase family domain-containing protein/HAD-superfamily hydrolase, subfamily IIIA [Micromonospora coriariae]|uniref:D,D-heptose 1,7-bisphosphate phosphatase n=1 Tax=Micromonospora coriariae TaxID=285665 RepID=A0A1C4XAM8_9ACTN|nr:HAD-IIIA family hydrolase [Micromonospora coriariae]SCF05570.1 histidinol-phosphate phosphatase family domain-containing protein/HAD-superfamily hydrolase, subfamily IIIA [Micromonospora coriariae]